MEPYGNSAAGLSSASSSSSSSVTSITKPQEMDGYLAEAGYKVRSSDLRHVAQRLERLENAMGNSPNDLAQFASDAVIYNPSDLASWVDSLLSSSDITGNVSDLDFPDDILNNQTTLLTDTWPEIPPIFDAVPPSQNLHHITTFTAMEEDSGIS